MRRLAGTSGVIRESGALAALTGLQWSSPWPGTLGIDMGASRAHCRGQRPWGSELGEARGL